MPHSGRVVIVTGAGRGIGLACARRFAKDGASIVIADIDEKAGESACEEIVANGGSGLFCRVDVGLKLDLHNMMAATLEAFDRVDVLVNNAGVHQAKSFFDLEDADWDRIMQVNLKGPFLASQSVARQIVKQIEREERSAEGRYNYSIINISSVDAIMTSPDQIPYAVSKGGLNQLTKVLSLALAPNGIRVNGIGPGSIMTESMRELIDKDGGRKQILERTPLGRIGSPDEIAGIASFLASNEASYITGQCIYADGGRLAQNFAIKKESEE